MGVKLLILLALVVGALYCLHLLAQDYQKLQGKRLLFKRDLNNRTENAGVRWKLILSYDTAMCARSLFCQIGQKSRGDYTEMDETLAQMIKLKPRSDNDAYEKFVKAFNLGFLNNKSTSTINVCLEEFYQCPFKADSLLKLIEYLINKNEKR